MPTREEIEAELKQLPPEQHAAFLAEVERRMQNVTLPGADTIRPTPPLEQGIKIPLPTPGLNYELPFSTVDLMEAIPGIGGTVGAALSGGSPAGAGLGATAGEAGRQLLRRLVGYPAASGNV